MLKATNKMADAFSCVKSKQNGRNQFGRRVIGGLRPLLELQDRDAQLLGLVGEVFLDAISREDENAHGQHVQHGVVALEGCGLGVFGPIGLEGYLRDLAGFGPFDGDEFGPLGAATVEKDHVGIFGLDLIELAPDQAVIVEVGPAGEGPM